MRPRPTIPGRTLLVALAISIALWGIAAYAFWGAVKWASRPEDSSAAYQTGGAA